VHSVRLLIDSLVALMLAAVLGGVVLHYRHEDAERAAIEQTQESLRTIRQQVMVHAALADATLTPEGFPERLEPEWFRFGIPRNHVVGPGHGWIEVAGPDQKDLAHPPVRVVREREAGFWYNPYRGVIRARVPENLTDAAAVRLYNRVNGTTLMSLDEAERASRG
jgi:hypothetical protein